MSLNTEQGMDEAQERKHRLNMHRMKNALFQGESSLISKSSIYFSSLRNKRKIRPLSA
jgi:hypothetical protein